MFRHRVVNEVDVEKTPRVQQVAGIFDCAIEKKSTQSWDFDFSLPDEWNVGLIVGPSGCGKSTIARHLWPDRIIERWDWPTGKSVLDGFPKDMGIKDISELLSSVGFSSPPAWVRPFHALSNGEQFRVTLARTLAELKDVAVVDEFSSVVDRQVAQVGSTAVAKTVRRRGQKLVAVSCHYDILDWLDPDWIFQPVSGVLERRSLQGRPKLEMEVYRASRDAWNMFKSHHYMSSELSKTAQCFVGTIRGNPVAFTSYIHFMHAKARDIKMEHRTVVLPDYQGLGISGGLTEWLGQTLSAKGFRLRATIAHPALIASRNRSLRWKHCGVGALPGASSRKGKPSVCAKQVKVRRLATHSFEYIPFKIKTYRERTRGRHREFRV